MAIFVVVRWTVFAAVLFGIYSETGVCTTLALLAVCIWSESVRSVLRKFDGLMVSLSNMFRLKAQRGG
jgi:hypothetical protein